MSAVINDCNSQFLKTGLVLPLAGLANCSFVGQHENRDIWRRLHLFRDSSRVLVINVQQINLYLSLKYIHINSFIF
jgi:hypothetical protein